MDGEAESFADRLEAVAWDLVKRLKPGNSPMILLAMLNAKRSHQYRPATAVDPVTARDTLSELRQLASSGPTAQVAPGQAEHWDSGETAESGGNGPEPGDQEPDGATAD